MTNAPLSPAELEAIEARVNAATEGPWRIVKYGDGDSLVIHSDDDNRVCFMATPGGSQASWRTICGNAAFIESAPVDMSRLLSALKAARDDNERLRAAIRPLVASDDLVLSAFKAMSPGDTIPLNMEVRFVIAATEAHGGPIKPRAALTQGAAHE